MVCFSASVRHCLLARGQRSAINQGTISPFRAHFASPPPLHSSRDIRGTIRSHMAVRWRRPAAYGNAAARPAAYGNAAARRHSRRNVYQNSTIDYSHNAGVDRHSPGGGPERGQDAWAGEMADRAGARARSSLMPRVEPWPLEEAENPPHPENHPTGESDLGR